MKRFSAYYYSLEATGVAEIDAILKAIADAGHAAHNTEDLDGELVDKIESAAKKAAEKFRELADKQP